MTGIPILVLIVILLVAGYVVYRSLVEERRGKRGEGLAGGRPGGEPGRAGPPGTRGTGAENRSSGPTGAAPQPAPRRQQPAPRPAGEPRPVDDTGTPPAAPGEPSGEGHEAPSPEAPPPEAPSPEAQAGPAGRGQGTDSPRQGDGRHLPPGDTGRFGTSGGRPGQRPRGRARSRRTPAYDPSLHDHVDKLRQAIDDDLISTDEAVASLVRSSGGSLDDDSARAILAQPGSTTPGGS